MEVSIFFSLSLNYFICCTTFVTTESQNHKMVEVGRHLWRSSCPTPLLKQGHLQAVAQDHVQTAFEYPKDGDFTAAMGKLCQCSGTLTVKVSRCSQGTSMFQFVPSASGPVLGHHWEHSVCHLYTLSLFINR